MLVEEAPRLGELLRRCGKRVRHAFNQAKDNALPDPHVLEWAKFYKTGIVEVARAIAEANKAGASQPALSKAEYEEEMALIGREYVAKLPAEERVRLLREAGEPSAASPITPTPEPWD